MTIKLNRTMSCNRYAYDTAGLHQMNRFRRTQRYLERTALKGIAVWNGMALI